MRNVKVLHLEPTDVCQAACPLCFRETDPDFRKDRQHHLAMDQILQVFDQEKIQQLDKMFMCGNYGDPAAGRYTLDIYREFRRLNPNIVLGMNTNGGTQNPVWWHKLGKMCIHPQDYVIFSIDGLEDTNHVYRKNVVWSKIIANIESFIAAGGSAHWEMLVYKHNQHQVDQCEQLAKDMGFKWFRAKVSRRKLSDSLEFPIGWKSIETKINNNINCYALNEKSVYIDAQGNIGPCCWLGARQQNFITDIDNIPTTDKICKIVCGQTSSGTSFDQQYQRSVELC